MHTVKDFSTEAKNTHNSCSELYNSSVSFLYLRHLLTRLLLSREPEIGVSCLTVISGMLSLGLGDNIIQLNVSDIVANDVS